MYYYSASPVVGAWPVTLQPYLKSIQIFKCPSDSRDVGCSYVMNNYFHGTASAGVDSPSTTLLATEGDLGQGGNRSMTLASSNYGLNEDYSLYNQTGASTIRARICRVTWAPQPRYGPMGTLSQPSPLM